MTVHDGGRERRPRVPPSLSLGDWGVTVTSSVAWMRVFLTFTHVSHLLRVYCVGCGWSYRTLHILPQNHGRDGLGLQLWVAVGYKLCAQDTWHHVLPSTHLRHYQHAQLHKQLRHVGRREHTLSMNKHAETCRLMKESDLQHSYNMNKQKHEALMQHEQAEHAG